jgi:hypothetical protein
MEENFKKLVDKIDKFIRRYYLNLLLKGSLLFGAGFLILFLCIVILENFGYFNQSIRFGLFYGFLAFNAFVLIGYVIRPLLGLMKIGRRINAEEAARLIGIYFKKEVRDKITNALQLKNYLDKNPKNIELVMAGIDQKSSSVIPLPFQNAIDLKSNLRFLPFLVVPLAFTAGFFLVRPSLILEPVHRIVRYDTHFERPSPFIIEMTSPNQGFRNESLNVRVKSRGDVFPSDAVLHYLGGKFNMEMAGNGEFSYTLRNLQESFQLMVEAGGFLFGPFAVEVLQRPLVHQFTLNVQPPAYTGLSAEQYSNVGDVIVPQGADLTWEIGTRGSGEIDFLIGDEALEVAESGRGFFQVRNKAFNSFDYNIIAHNERIGRGDSLKFHVQVRPDSYPYIQVEDYRDSVLIAHIFHRGLIQDDYGFDRLEFHYRMIDQRRNGDDKAFLKENLEINPSLTQQEFYHHLDLNTLYIQPGETIEYFFLVFDNDAINGPKSSRSHIFSFYVPTREEMIAQQRESQEQIKSEMSDGVGEARKAQDEIQSLRKQLLESERMSWEQRESLKNLLDRQQQIQESMDQITHQKKQDQIRDEQFNEADQRIKQKQEELQRLFDDVLSEDLKDLFEKIREELDKLDKGQVYDMLEKMEFGFRDMEMQMDRALELFKQLEMEILLQNALNMLDQAMEEQGKLNEETATGGDTQELSESQQEINQSFENIMEMLEDFREKNQQLSRPQNIEDTSSQENSIQQNLEKALQQLKNDSPSGAKPHQQQGQQGMQQLSQRLQMMQQSLYQEQLAEDARALRQILENLLKSSFSQEDLMLEMRGINVNDPRYVELVQEQRKIKDDMKMVEDSLIALSKRQIQIQGYVTREIAEVNMNLDRALDDLVNRRRFQGASRQQFVMTHINNLALLLNESLQNMNEQMSQMEGMGEPNQSGDGMPTFKGLNQMQQQLNQMLQQLQQGHQPMPGETGQGMSMSEQLARMAAEQEAIRNQLRSIAEEFKRSGLDGSELEQIQREMERTELDIVTRNITRQTVIRQERILTRLLEHERAQMEREMEERREGTTAENFDLSNPAELFEYNRKRNRELEMLKRLPIGLRPYYRSLVENYFLNVE